MTTRALVFALFLSFVLPFSSQAAVTGGAQTFVRAPITEQNRQPVSCEVTASSKFVQPGEKVTISWVARYPILGFYLGSNTEVPPSGSMIVAPTETTIYKFKFAGIGPFQRCGVRVRVAGDEVPA